MRKLLVFLLHSIVFLFPAFSNDSIYFYKADEIIYSQAINNIDSITFASDADYRHARSLFVLKTLENNKSTSDFASWIVTAGMQLELDSATIWVPNSATMSSYSHITDVQFIRRFVSNHISRTSQMVYMIDGVLDIKMYGGKIHQLKHGSNATINEVEIESRNQTVALSVFHILKGNVPYHDNIWEYISSESGHDKMKAFVNSYNTLKHDSVSGVDVLYNPLKEIYPFLTDETKSNTVFIPDDTAWDEAWNALLPYYGDQTSKAVFQHLFFPGELYPGSLDTVLTSYSNHCFSNPERLFEGAVPVKLSNGIGYKTSHLDAYNPAYNDYSKIVIEAEQGAWGRSQTNYNLNVVAHTSDSLMVSDGHFISATATSTLSTALLSVIFPIPNTIIGKYNIYCVFAPANIINADNLKPYKVIFALKNTNAVNPSELYVGVNNSLITTNSQAVKFITNPTGMTKMLVYENYEFTKSNVFLSTESFTSAENSIDFQIRVRNAAGTTASEKQNFNRDINIDCIILERVE